MWKIQPWIVGRTNKQICMQAIEKKSTGAWTNNHNLLMQWCTKLELGSFYSPGISPLTKIYIWQSIYISVPDNEGVFTEKRSSINSFVTATWTNSHNSKTNPSTKTKQRFLNSQWAGRHNVTQDLLIRVLIHWLLRQSITCIILLLDFVFCPLFLYCSLLQKYCCAYIDGFLKLGHICS